MPEANGWLRRFDDPIVLPDGKKLVTLRDAIKYLSETVPERDHKHPKILLAATILTNVAEGRDFSAGRGRAGRFDPKTFPHLLSRRTRGAA